MNCHRARQLISPYLDQQLTGREMLALQGHFAVCPSCEREMQSIRQVKALLRGLREPRPPRDFPGKTALRLERTEATRRYALSLPRPQHGRRLASALALSCLTVVSFALPFAPDAAHSSLFRPAPGAAFSAPAPTDPLLSGRMTDRLMLLPAGDLTRLPAAGMPPPAPSGVLTLTGMEAPEAVWGMPPRSQDIPFSGSVQYAVFRPR